MLNRILHYIRCEAYFDMRSCTEMKHNATENIEIVMDIIFKITMFYSRTWYDAI